MTSMRDNRVLNRMAQLSPQQLKQLASRKSEQRGAGLPARQLQGLRRAGEKLPLSYGQERLWFVEQMGLVGLAYHMTIALRIEGELDETALEWSFGELVRRHESLRTHFEAVDGQPCQVIDAADTFAVRRLAPAEIERADDEDILQAFARQEFQRPFDLARGDLFRASVLHLSEREYGLTLALHHIISDGWSNAVMMRELRWLYQSYRHGRLSPLDEPPAQYADYALWQRQSLEGEVLNRQLAYWRMQLADAPCLLELPTDRVRPTVSSHAGRFYSFSLPKSLSDALSQLARRHDATVFMLLLAAFQAVLSRWSGQSDLIVGTPVAGRAHPQTEGMIGLFVNMLALRAQLDHATSFAELLAQAKETALAAYAHQDLPFEKLVQEMAPARDLSRQPIFQVMLVLQNMAKDQLQLENLRLEELPGEHVTAKFDLTLVLEETDEGLRGELEYATDLFDRSTMARFANHFARVLEQVVRHPQMRLDQLDLLSAEERDQQVTQWNATQTAYPKNDCIHQLFEAQARRTPQAPAVIFQGQTLSYSELDRQANQLAQHLRQRGVGPETVVALCVPRCLEMMVGLLGILKAGGAYLPIDPSYPVSRMAFMLEDSAAAALLTVVAMQDRLPAYAGPVLRLDADAAEFAGHSEQAPVSGVSPQNLAYVIYTSGSTGQPKGVMVKHHALVNYVSYAAKTFEADVGIGAPINLPLSFDGTITALYPPLIAGTALWLIPDGGEEIDGLVELFEHTANHSVMKITPSFLAALQDVLPPEHMAQAVRTLVIGGQALAWKDIERWRRFAPTTRIYNHYGPTETVVGCIVHPVGEGDRGSGNIPIGRPIANVQVYVLDEGHRVVPVGVVGELYIGGEGLARGYLNRPSLTAQRFVANPHGEPGSRLYRTGDLVRYRADGNLEFLGRIDHQVKVRGFRIELGEIEARLVEHADIHEAAVIARAVGGDERLVAYVIPVAGATVEVASLREHLGQRLPDYMVPAAFVTLAQLPLTRNGKLDRKALPAPDAQAVATRAFESPQGEIEIAMAEIWQALLTLPQVGRHDHFFELGGHSLLAMQLVARIRKEFYVDVPVSTLFEKPQLSVLADAVFVRQAESLLGEDMKAIRDELASLSEDELRTILAEDVVDAEDIAKGGVRDNGVAGVQAFASTLRAYGLSSESMLDPAIFATQSFQKIAAPKHVFLTGATGFLGSFLLSSLLRMTDAVVYCLIRCSDAQQGLRRIEESLALLDLSDDYDPRRIVAVPGNLSLTLLGLDETCFVELAQTIDVIYHNGARVNFLHTYDTLKADNVLGTQEILRLASQGRVKEVHYVSTLSVLRSGKTSEANPTISEEESLEHWKSLSTGYAQSKWVAEQLLRIGAARGVPSTVYRPPNISGATTSGASNSSDTWSRFIDACLELGCVPDIDGRINMLAVDHVSRCIVELSVRMDVTGKSLNLISAAPTHLSHLVDSILSAGIVPMVKIPYSDWLASCAAEPSTAVLALVLPGAGVFENGAAKALGHVDGPAASMLDPNDANSHICPPVTAELMRKYVRWRQARRMALKLFDSSSSSPDQPVVEES